jgi:hypothetical protein
MLTFKQQYTNPSTHSFFFLALYDFVQKQLDVSPQGSTFVGTGSGVPEVPELPSARGCSRVIRLQGGQILGTGVPGWGWAQG